MPSWDEPQNCVPWNYRKRQETKRREGETVGNDVTVVTDTQDRQTSCVKSLEIKPQAALSPGLWLI